jgi:hypothetical protein
MTRRRRWFQLHLSTVVVLTVIAGGFVGLNTRCRHSMYGSMSGSHGEAFYGWPVQCVCRTYRLKPGDTATPIQMREDGGTLEFSFSPSGIAINVGCLIAMVAAVGLSLEFWIRRRNPRT